MSDHIPDASIVSFESKPCKRVSFCEDVKIHDGLSPSTKLFEKLVLFYIRIGGMTAIKEMTDFIRSHGEPTTNHKIREELTVLADDLLERMIAVGSIPILGGGGGSNYKIPTHAYPNIAHMCIALEKELEMQKKYSAKCATDG